MVGGQTADRYTFPDIEIIDMASSESNCSKFESFPGNISSAIGGLDFKNSPFICGGTINNSCYNYENGRWNQGVSMNEGRYLAASLSIANGHLVTGGSDSGQNSSEIQTSDGWEYFLPNLPVNIWFHCMVEINSTTIMVIAGAQNGTYTYGNYSAVQTFLLENGKDHWIEGPPLLSGRHAHSCGRIRQSSDISQMSVIVVGGRASEEMISTEILDLETFEWRQGPDLPYGISCSVLVEEPSGSVILIGGQSQQGIARNVTADIFRLAHAGEGAEWELLPQKLQFARRFHRAFFVPDEIVDCS